MQFVRVEVEEGRAYTYKWDDSLEPPLEPGEPVLLPGNMVHAEPFIGWVLRSMKEPGWDGEIKSVISRVEPKQYSEDDDESACLFCGEDDCHGRCLL